MISDVWEKWERISRKLMFWRHSLEVRGGSWDSFRLYGFIARLVPFYVSSAVVFVFVCFAKFLFQWFIFFRFGSDVGRLRVEKRPRPLVLSVFVGKRRVFSRAWPTVHTVFGENGHQKRIISKTVSSVKLFEFAGHLFSCGRTKTEVSEYDDVIHHLALA